MRDGEDAGLGLGKGRERREGREREMLVARISRNQGKGRDGERLRRDDVSL